MEKVFVAIIFPHDESIARSEQCKRKQKKKLTLIHSEMVYTAEMIQNLFRFQLYQVIDACF